MSLRSFERKPSATAITIVCDCQLLSCRVCYQDFVYPRYDTPLIEAYDGRFESCFVILHPFVRVPAELSWKTTGQYPTDDQILSAGAKCTWGDIASNTGLRACARVNQALLTSIGSLAPELCDFEARNALQTFLETEPVWMPVEGRFEPLLQFDFLGIFETAGTPELIHVPEYPETAGIRRLNLDPLAERAESFPTHGSLVAPDASFLFTVDWDSFFTLFYGSRAFVSEAVQRRNLEGFFVNLTTEHFWFNYSMGCATVTISPEHWPVPA